MLKDSLQSHSLVWLAVFCFFLSWIPANSLAQDETTPYVLGKVESFSGEPASEAKVWLVGWDDNLFEGPPKILSQTVCDSAGKFSFDLANPDFHGTTR